MSADGSEYNPLIYEFPYSAKDEYTQDLLERLDLPRDASLADIEPIVRVLWERMPHRHEAMELVLGRNVTSQEVSTHPVMGRILLVDDTDKALFDLLILRTAEDQHPPTDEPHWDLKFRNNSTPIPLGHARFVDSCIIKSWEKLFIFR